LPFRVAALLRGVVGGQVTHTAESAACRSPASKATEPRFSSRHELVPFSTEGALAFRRSARGGRALARTRLRTLQGAEHRMAGRAIALPSPTPSAASRPMWRARGHDSRSPWTSRRSGTGAIGVARSRGARRSHGRWPSRVGSALDEVAASHSSARERRRVDFGLGVVGEMGMIERGSELPCSPARTSSQRPLLGPRSSAASRAAGKYERDGQQTPRLSFASSSSAYSRNSLEHRNRG